MPRCYPTLPPACPEPCSLPDLPKVRRWPDLQKRAVQTIHRRPSFLTQPCVSRGGSYVALRFQTLSQRCCCEVLVRYSTGPTYRHRRVQRTRKTHDGRRRRTDPHYFSRYVIDLSKGADPDRPTPGTHTQSHADPNQREPTHTDTLQAHTHSHTQTPTEQARPTKPSGPDRLLTTCRAASPNKQSSKASEHACEHDADRHQPVLLRNCSRLLQSFQPTHARTGVLLGSHVRARVEAMKELTFLQQRRRRRRWCACV